MASDVPYSSETWSVIKSLEVCNLSKRDLQSLDFTVNGFFYEIILYKRYVRG